jgi:hypothetical protein
MWRRKQGAVSPAVDGGGRVPAPEGGVPGSEISVPDGGSVDASAALACSDLFDAGTLQQFSFDISDDQWEALESEFNDLTDLKAGIDFATYHPLGSQAAVASERPRTPKRSAGGW